MDYHLSSFIFLLLTLQRCFSQCWYQSATCTVGSTLGFCGNNTASCCPGGSITAGLCPGPSNIECCTSPTCNTPQGSGICIATSACTGTAVAGYCEGPSNLQCCVKGAPTGHYGVDVSELISTSSFTCLKNNNPSFDWVVMRAYRSTGSVDPNACNTLNNARSAGISVRDGYIFPCPTCGTTGSSQIAATVSNLKSCASASWSGVLWLDIEGTQYWSTSTTTNQNFFNSLVSGCNSQGIKCGVYTSSSQWSPIMGSSFNGGSALLLWYPHYQSPPQPNFNDFASFGGWTSPFAKQYAGDDTLCSAGVDLNWTPNTPDSREE